MYIHKYIFVYLNNLLSYAYIVIMYRVDTSLYLYYQFEYFAFSSIVQTFGF